MKILVSFLTLVSLNSFALADEETSILFPKQVQPKLTTRQRCELDGEWKKYGSLKECVDEKRHEEVLAKQTRSARRQEQLAYEAALRDKEMRDDARSRYEAEELRRLLKNLNGNSR